MRVTIAAVGRDRKSLFRDLYDTYAQRLRWPINLREVEARSNRGGEVQRREEGERLLAAVPQGALVIALDESGKTLTSRGLADWISRGMDDGMGDLALVIGGADGLDGDVLVRADLTLSLGRLTWPHLLVRGLVVEQLYRVQQIIAGHPYHRD
jgi:23S rRNA (pseudouridine1915-N3)-methyltransferase